MNKWFKDMLEHMPDEMWLKWELEKKNKWHIFGDAQVIIKIAQWRAMEIIKQQAIEDLRQDSYIQMRDMLSSLKLENWLLFDPRMERETIDHYRNPRRLSATFRSQRLDYMFLIEIMRAKYEDEIYQRVKHKIFPYLPPYDTNP